MNAKSLRMILLVAAGIIHLFSAPCILSHIDKVFPCPDFTILDNARMIVIYDYIMRDDNVEKPMNGYVSLTIGPKVSMFQGYSNFIGDSLNYAKRATGTTFNEYHEFTSKAKHAPGDLPKIIRYHDREDSIRVYYLLLLGGRMEKMSETHYRVVTPTTFYHAKYDDAPAIDWEITDEKKKIGDIEVTKATGRHRGRDWTVWFAESLPYFEGPWELAGLPGLILEAYDSEGKLSFEFQQMRPINMPILLDEKSSEYKMLTRGKVRQTRADKLASEQSDYRTGRRNFPPISTFLDPE